MIWNQSFLNDTLITYSFARQAAIAGRFQRMQRPQGEMYTMMPQFDALFYRWNMDDAQANIYGYAGFGGSRFLQDTSWAAISGIEADAESRRLYVSGKFQTFFFKDNDRVYQSQFRIGAAPYLAQFNELSSWLILSVQHEPQLTREWIVTPMLRMFYKNVLWEIGSSFKGDWMINGMVHF
mgnify:CR=1 FL=1